MNKIIVEICCGSADDVFAAAKAGADRVELNSAVHLGGLTPTLGELNVAKRAVVPVMCMVRPRTGGFCYTDREFETMCLDAELLVKNGADGIVFGILNADGSIDRERCRELLGLIGNTSAVFHRAIDVVTDWRRAIDELYELGFARILTSGQAQTALEGAQTIKEMVEYAAGRIEILPGSGIRAENVGELLRQTGCSQVHASANKSIADSSCAANPYVNFNSKACPEHSFNMTDHLVAAALIKQACI